MIDALRQIAWRHISHTFPERQIYIRSEGRVQFFTFDPMLQLVCAGAGIVILGWVAFTSVNVIFKDRIIAAKERHFVEMQSAYEGRIADLQISYDELNGALANAEDRFRAAADSFEAKQRTLAKLIEHKQGLQASLGIPQSSVPITPPVPLKPPQASSAPKPTYLGMNMGIGTIIEDLIPNLTQTLTPTSGAGIGPLRAMPPFASVSSAVPEDGAPATAAAVSTPQTQQRASFLDGAVKRIGQFFGRKPAAAEVDHPSLRHLAEEEARLSRLDEDNPVLLNETRQDVDKEVARLTKALRTAGVDPKVVVQHDGSALGQGGPLIPISPSQTISDANFNSSVAGAIGSLSTLDDIVASLQSMPLTTPLEDAAKTSSFGARSDPFTENLAFHTGIDFSGAKGTDVHVTAPGVVVFASRAGEYGNMVEVDHGNHIKTRYAHLMKINVPVGSRVQKGDVVGELGSTGRSTGPHVHYEIWYDNVVRDPQRFIRAGHDVFKEQQ
jgi:murein DD-endopeptidase MepM/ murein hydrolase activator NlpD